VVLKYTSEELPAIAITATTTTAAATISTATTAAAAITATAAAARRTLFAGTRFIDRQRSALEFFSVKLRNGRVRFGLRPHFDERETT